MPTDPQLLQIVNNALASATQRAVAHLTCRPGCSFCCHGVFEITALDAQRLRSALQALQHFDPAAAAPILERIAQARTHLTPFFPGNPETGALSEDPQKVELFEEWANADPCPILNPATQTCDLYAARPILCRTFGPPIRNDHEDPKAGLAICELNFTQATEAEIAAAEMDSSFRPLEQALESRTAGHPTMIPFAFS